MLRTPVAVLVLASFAAPAVLAQCDNCGPPAIDILGAHAASGRGCASCHAPHNESPTGAAAPGALWGETAAPAYGQKLAIGETGRAVEVVPSRLSIADAEVAGILLCISCHDGNITAQNMMAGQSYSARLGLLTRHERGRMLVSNDQLSGSYMLDHPLGPDATIPVGSGLEFSNGKFSVVPGSPYAEFVANYGWPTLAPLTRSNPYGIDALGRAYLVCTTCHNQHAMSAYVSSPASPIAGDTSGQVYTTFFFVKGPYNPNAANSLHRNSTSNEQFCRQCHFNFANEGNHSYNVRTDFY